MLAGAGDEVLIWDPATAQVLLEPLTGTHDSVTSVSFSRNGETLAWGSSSIQPTNELVVLWDTRLDTWRRLAYELANRNLTRDEWSQFLGGDSGGPSPQTCPRLPLGGSTG